MEDQIRDGYLKKRLIFFQCFNMSYRKNEDGKLEQIEEVITEFTLDELKAAKLLVESNLQKLNDNHDAETLVFQEVLSQIDEKISKCGEYGVEGNLARI